MPLTFSRYVLRTTDVAAASAFYTAVLGPRRDEMVALPEAAVGRGARPHWLGQIGVRELGSAAVVAERFVARGATRLGPPPNAGEVVVLRDPGGAIVALTDAGESPTDVVRHQLNTRELATATANYAALFGWSFTSEPELGPVGDHQRFAFGPGEAVAGMFSAVEGRPGVHTHWLFLFAVPDLTDALERVKRHGGLGIGPIELPNGERVAACDDPQGAAFGLLERSRVKGDRT